MTSISGDLASGSHYQITATDLNISTIGGSPLRYLSLQMIARVRQSGCTVTVIDIVGERIRLATATSEEPCAYTPRYRHANRSYPL